MLWVKSLHIIGFVAWFAGLFYLPRLFVYHTQAVDENAKQHFQKMEYKLYRYIMWPAGIFTTLMGIWLLKYGINYYLQAPWMHAKLLLILLLWIYHLYCGHLVRVFAREANQYSETFYRWFNEIPTVLLIGIVILAVVKPF